MDSESRRRQPREEPGWLASIGASLEQLAGAGREGLDRMLDQRVRIGVTGFSGSGKSTFVTSFVNQLLCHGDSALPALPPSLHERLLGVRLQPLAVAGLAEFPYRECLSALTAAAPGWPPSTRGLSGLQLEIRYRARRRLLRLPRQPVRSLAVEIRDYPGEWLLDLPLVRTPFRAWCIDRGGDYARAPRRELLGELFDRLQRIDPLAPFDAELHAALAEAHGAFLQRCKEQRLSLIQPGRYLLEDGRPEPPAQRFFPLPAVSAVAEPRLRAAPPESWFGALQSRYDRYVATQVRPFFQDYFRSVDRQVVLIDLLAALAAGREAFLDMTAAMSRVLDTFRFGGNSVLRRLFDPQIDRILYVASKIDHVHPGQHDGVRRLLWRLLREAIRDVGFDTAEVHTAVIAALRCTTPTRAGEGPDGLLTTMLDGRRGVMTHPPLPDRPPQAEDWQRLSGWRLPALRPPAGAAGALPHIRMDTVIRELIGDKFQ